MEKIYWAALSVGMFLFSAWTLRSEQIPSPLGAPITHSTPVHGAQLQIAISSPTLVQSWTNTLIATWTADFNASSYTLHCSPDLMTTNAIRVGWTAFYVFTNVVQWWSSPTGDTYKTIVLGSTYTDNDHLTFFLTGVASNGKESGPSNSAQYPPPPPTLAGYTISWASQEPVTLQVCTNFPPVWKDLTNTASGSVLISGVGNIAFFRGKTATTAVKLNIIARYTNSVSN